MENQVDGAKLAWKAEGDRVGAWFSYYVVWAQVLFREFFGWLPGPKKFHLDISLVANIQLRGLCPVLFCILPIPFLSLCDVLLQLCLDAFQIHHECLCLADDVSTCGST